MNINEIANSIQSEIDQLRNKKNEILLNSRKESSSFAVSELNGQIIIEGTTYQAHKDKIIDELSNSGWVNFFIHLEGENKHADTKIKVIIG